MFHSSQVVLRTPIVDALGSSFHNVQPESADRTESYNTCPILPTKAVRRKAKLRIVQSFYCGTLLFALRKRWAETANEGYIGAALSKVDLSRRESPTRHQWGHWAASYRTA